MKTAYLLSCTCGRKCEVDAGQAGSQVFCGCGKVLAVPSVRGLRQLETTTADEEKPERAPWNPARGAIFSLGLLVAVLAILFSAYHGYWFFITTKTGDPVAMQLGIENQHIDHLSAVDTVQLFRQEEREGLGDPNPPAWTEIDKLHASSRWWGIAGLIVAGAGLLATVASTVGTPKRGH